jgi:hypothetical protein
MAEEGGLDEFLSTIPDGDEVGRTAMQLQQLQLE